MRSRYTAYVLQEVDYLVETTSPSSRTPDLSHSIREWINQVEWQKLHVISTHAGKRTDTEGIVEFIAEYAGSAGVERHHERSLFKKERGTWYYVSGESPE